VDGLPTILWLIHLIIFPILWGSRESDSVSGDAGNPEESDTNDKLHALVLLNIANLFLTVGQLVSLKARHFLSICVCICG
jgi:hypothetical protein